MTNKSPKKESKSGLHVHMVINLDCCLCCKALKEVLTLATVGSGEGVAHKHVIENALGYKLCP